MDDHFYVLYARPNDDDFALVSAFTDNITIAKNLFKAKLSIFIEEKLSFNYSSWNQAKNSAHYKTELTLMDFKNLDFQYKTIFYNAGKVVAKTFPKKRINIKEILINPNIDYFCIHNVELATNIVENVLDYYYNTDDLDELFEPFDIDLAYLDFIKLPNKADLIKAYIKENFL